MYAGKPNETLLSSEQNSVPLFLREFRYKDRIVKDAVVPDHMAHDSQIHRACQNPVELDVRQADAVEARISLDLRLGAAFTRFQTLQLQSRVPELAENVISYGEPHQSFVGERIQFKSCLLPNHQGPASTPPLDSFATSISGYKISSPSGSGTSTSLSNEMRARSSLHGVGITCLISPWPSPCTKCVSNHPSQGSRASRRNRLKNGK